MKTAILQGYGNSIERSNRMVKSIVNGDKKLHILMNSAINESEVLDLYIKRYQASLIHPLFNVVWNAKGDNVE